MKCRTFRDSNLIEVMFVSWNLWHGCQKISPGCKHCYVYRQDKLHGIESSIVTKTSNFDLPVKRKRDKSYKIPSGEMVNTCFTSDFFVEGADEWRKEAWAMMKERGDLQFFIITKRVDRFRVSLPDDWGDGYENVAVACTVENQTMADYRLPIYKELPIRHKLIVCAPLLEAIDLKKYLDSSIEQVSVGGESGNSARVCDYEWILDIRQQCLDADVPFWFHQTGAYFRKDGRIYRIRRKFQHTQARKANINYGVNPL